MNLGEQHLGKLDPRGAGLSITQGKVLPAANVTHENSVYVLGTIERAGD